MMQYVNRYFGAFNPDKNEVVLTFMQEIPSANFAPIPGNGVQKLPIQDISVEQVANLVMSKDCAYNLMCMLQQLTSQGETSDTTD